MKIVRSIIFALLLATTLSCFSQTIKKGPYLILTGKNTEMKVLWQNTAPGSDQIRWGTDQSYSLGNGKSKDYGKDFQHSYIISGLTPGTRYYYQVQVGNISKNGSFFTPPSTSATSVKFLAYGDTRTNADVHNDVARQINSTFKTDSGYQTVLLSMGDLVSAGFNESRWSTEFFNPDFSDLNTMLASIPYESTIGNHELRGSSTLFGKYFPYPFASNFYYSFDYGPAHFIVLDQLTTSFTVGSAQYTWLVNELASSKKLWKFIYFHEPGWSAGGGHRNNTTVQNVIEPLCEKYNVPIVFAGHNHYYARATVQAAGGLTIQHITTGGGGAPLYKPDPFSPKIVSCKSAYHFCKIKIVDQNTLYFEAVSIEGKIIDQFIINRTPAVKKK
jgi:hypothetical protein